MNQDHWESLLNRDWSAAWETLPEAPDLVPRPKMAQITLRVPASVLARLKRVAVARSLPYHALARSWILDCLRHHLTPATGRNFDEPQTEQLNIKLDNEALDELKARASELRRPYHRLARESIEAALGREEESLGLDPVPAGLPPIKDLMVLLLHATNSRGQDAVRGVTRLQKLLFVIEHSLGTQSGFYAYKYGPFNERVNDAALALRLAGFLRGSEPIKAALPSFAEIMAAAEHRSGPRQDSEVEEFALNERGHAAAKRLRQSSRAYDQLFDYVRTIRGEWDSPNLDDLVDRVYETWPKYAKESLIREEVAERVARKRRSSS